MLRITFVCAFLAFLIPHQITFGAVAPDEELPRVVREKLDALLEAYQAGNLVSVVRQSAPLLKKMEHERRELADLYLTGNGGIPLGKMIIDARLKLNESNVSARIPKPSFREAVVASAELKRRIESVQHSLATNPVSETPLPRADSLAAYKPMLWDLHVLRNQFTNAVNYCDTANRLLGPFKRRLDEANEEFTDRQWSKAKTDFRELHDKLVQQLDDIDQIEAELRIYRLEDATAALADATEFRDRLAAAFAMEFDSQVLLSYFEKNKDRQASFKRENLRDPGVAETIRGLTTKSRKSNAKVIEKARLLYVGMHWWYRGRYGAGPLMKGILKAPNAARNEQSLFPLYMPTKPPTPKDPYLQKNTMPRYERRHHYAWAAEYRPVGNRNYSHKEVTKKVPVSSDTSYFY